ncbi:MAG: glycosylase, partial [Planctomycetia bacterium]
LGIWRATSTDRKVWTNVSDEPVIGLGPKQYDAAAVALNQIVKRDGRYYAYYHGSTGGVKPWKWTTCIAVSDDLNRWTKFAGNPLLHGDESSGIVVPDGEGFRLYTMHGAVRLHRAAATGE